MEIKMRAVFEKEIRQYLVTPIGFIFVAVFFAFCSYFFIVGNLLTASADLSKLFGSVFSFLMILIPFLTMRTFAEERRLHTDQLLLTCPESIINIVLGKFAAAYVVFAIGCISFVPVFYILSVFDAIDILTIFGNILALFLIGGVFISIGLFASSLTENQIVAAIISYVIILGLWLIDYLRYYIQEELLIRIIEYLSFRAHFNILGSGVFYLSTLIYFISLTAFMLFFTRLSLDRARRR
ncbi:ABC transporter [Treponema parvum]|uniref:ABC transporter n=1 Tax=Treponema parvum TaxID=138851 RepID=A0A975F3J2_9SPIR|nr:hypothetical protein [Treponema parvum]QTQ13688.1 ABC transporter [Treponema parvum]